MLKWIFDLSPFFCVLSALGRRLWSASFFLISLNLTFQSVFVKIVAIIIKSVSYKQNFSLLPFFYQYLLTKLQLVIYG